MKYFFSFIFLFPFSSYAGLTGLELGAYEMVFQGNHEMSIGIKDLFIGYDNSISLKMTVGTEFQTKDPGCVGIYQIKDFQLVANVYCSNSFMSQDPFLWSFILDLSQASPAALYGSDAGVDVSLVMPDFEIPAIPLKMKYLFQ